MGVLKPSGNGLYFPKRETVEENGSVDGERWKMCD
jgi:hypothetical protein